MAKKEIKENKVEEQVVPTEIVEEVTEVKEEKVEETPVVKYKVNNCKKLNIRKKADIKSNVVCIVDETNELTIEEIDNKEWVKVITDSGKKGFCMKKYIAVK
jgi:uncharacterized protein YgiM (DUF1202 family)